MSADAQPQPATEPTENHAVARCCAASKKAYDAAQVNGRSRYDCSEVAKDAYRAAMPPLSSPENIRDFVACIAQGILLEIIPRDQTTRLLYAAQVAISAHRKPSAPRKPATE
jgi:hypothetical protein